MLLVFTDTTTVENLRAICLDHAKLGENSLSPTLDSRFFGPSPSQVLYLTEVRSVTLLHLNSAKFINYESQFSSTEDNIIQISKVLNY